MVRKALFEFLHRCLPGPRHTIPTTIPEYLGDLNATLAQYTMGAGACVNENLALYNTTTHPQVTIPRDHPYYYYVNTNEAMHGAAQGALAGTFPLVIGVISGRSMIYHVAAADIKKVVHTISEQQNKNAMAFPYSYNYNKPFYVYLLLPR